MAKTVVRAAYAYDTDAVSLETALVMPEGEGRTVQADREESDINVILDRFGITGHMPQNLRPPTYQDFGPDVIFDFRSAVEAIALAEDAFMQLPAKVRAEFANDPQEFVAFCSNEKNLPRMRELGLAIPHKEPEPEKVMKVEVVEGSALGKKKPD